MAIYSLHHSAIGRTTHRAGTAGAHVAYVTRRRAASDVLTARMPLAAPGLAAPARDWLDAHEAASRKNARVADRIMIALPLELDADQRKALVSDFAEALTGGRAPWLAAIHANGKDAANPHAHVMLVDRDPMTGKRVVGMSDKGSTERVRLLWERHANAALATVGVGMRIDRRSLAEQGVERIPEIHVGPTVQAMLARGAEPISRDRVDHRGREIRWTEIDAGRSRADRRAEIVAENEAQAKNAKWKALAGTWELCARQLAADQAEREAAKRTADAAEAQFKITDSRRRLDRLGVRLTVAFSREMERIAEARKVIAVLGCRLATAARALLQNRSAVDAREAEEPSELDLEALRENMMRSIAYKTQNVINDRWKKQAHQLELVRSRNRGRAPGDH